MSSGHRAYLITAAFHFGLIGLSILLIPEMYGSTAFEPIVENTRLFLWGSAYLITGVLCGVASVTRWPAFARAGLIMAFAVLTVSAFAVGWGVVVTWIDDDPALASPVIPLSFMALAVKDLLVVGRPLGAPLEHDEAQARLEPT